MNPTKTVRTKTVEEVNIEKGCFALWRPRLRGKRCGCFENPKYDDDAFLCYDCCGIGIEGGYNQGRQVVDYTEASYEEVQRSTNTVGNVTTTSQIHPEDEWTTLTFYCALPSHIYYRCIFELDHRYWSVVNVEEDSEDDDGLPLPSRWMVTCRKVHEYEAQHYFLKNQEHKSEELLRLESMEHDVLVLEDEEGPMLVNMNVFKAGAKLLYVCPECGENVTVDGPRGLDEEIEDEIHCGSCGHTWSNEEDLKRRGLEE